MKRNTKIEVKHLTRVEGHGNVHIEIADGQVVEAKWAVVETPRFFEAILKGKSHDLAPTLTSRICGICSIGHTLASLRAVERAMGIGVPRKAQLLRLLAKHGETLQSHALHVFFLTTPDFFDAGSVLPLIESHPEVVRTALRIKGLANGMCDLVAGRTTHPVSLVVGGVSKSPGEKELESLKKGIQEKIPDILAAVELFGTLRMPDFERETEFVSLEGAESYPWIGGNLVSSDGVKMPEDDYLAMTNEYKEDFSTSKFARLSRVSFAVGALARFNNNHRYLRREAGDAAEALGLKPVSHNPFMNNVAQLVECYHVMLDSLEIIDELLEIREETLRAPYEVKAGRGVGAVEVPRGVLYHDLEIDGNGKIAKTNCIIPTTQNNANIHYDLKELVAQEAKRRRSDAEITLLSEMLVRAYDPCISCSVH